MYPNPDFRSTGQTFQPLPNPAYQAPPEPNGKGIPTELNLLGSNLNRLNDLVVELKSKLAPVMTQNPFAMKVKGVSEQKSQIADSINYLNGLSLEIQNSVEEILYSLDV